MCSILQVRLYTLEENHMLCFKVEMHVSVPAEQTFHLLSDLTRRKEWDQHYELVTNRQNKLKG